MRKAKASSQNPPAPLNSLSDDTLRLVLDRLGSHATAALASTSKRMRRLREEQRDPAKKTPDGAFYVQRREQASGRVHEYKFLVYRLPQGAALRAQGYGDTIYARPAVTGVRAYRGTREGDKVVWKPVQHPPQFPWMDLEPAGVTQREVAKFTYMVVATLAADAPLLNTAHHYYPRHALRRVVMGRLPRNSVHTLLVSSTPRGPKTQVATVTQGVAVAGIDAAIIEGLRALDPATAALLGTRELPF